MTTLTNVSMAAALKHSLKFDAPLTVIVPSKKEAFVELSALVDEADYSTENGGAWDVYGAADGEEFRFHIAEVGESVQG
jgi:hypothetical protein